MKMSFKNSFHDTETTAEATETGLTKHGERYAEFTHAQIYRISVILCGIRQCTCHKFESRCYDAEDRDYVVTLSSIQDA